jgi:type IV pilus assembly protein PilB
MKESAIGDLLMQAGLVDASGLLQARETQVQKAMSLGKALAILGLVDEEISTAAIAKKLHMESVGNEIPQVTSEVRILLSADFCRKKLVIPLNITGGVLRLAMTDPLDLATIQDAEFQTGKRVTAVVAGETQIQTLLKKYYERRAETRESVLATADSDGEVEAVREQEFELVDPAKLAKDVVLPPIIRLVNSILSNAAKDGASDIHLEPKETHLQVRHRVDGLLQDVMTIPKNLKDATLSRIKVLSGMDITERRRPQDGRSRLRFEGKRIDLRVSTLPTQFGEKAVIRLLHSSRALLEMEGLDFTPENLRQFKLLLSRPQGMVLVTGPTGSGKSSTLYTALNWVRSSTNNIITVEDPIEYQLEGVSQVQINVRAGITFAAGLRSILRQDPNIILVGEIRDRETAGIALEAAQTGHLLLSTLHTNDAPATITRLLDLGVEPFLIASALLCIVGQRLVRRPCPICAVPQIPTREQIYRAGGDSQMPPDARWMVGNGCEECKGSGYKGRVAIHELLQVNEEIRELISRRSPEHAIRKAARTAGMRTLLEDGVRKASSGLTTLEEVFRAVASESEGTHKDASTMPIVSVPSTTFAPEEQEPVVSIPEPPVLESEKQEGGSRQKEKVLVVEDSRTILAVVKYFLELEGFEVLTASDGIAGIDVAKTQQPRVIITDYNMPGMDGMAMVKSLRSDPQTRGVAIIMLTSEESIERETQALSAGADDYILKPVEPRRLAARVKALIARSNERALVESK